MKKSVISLIFLVLMCLCLETFGESSWWKVTEHNYIDANNIIKTDKIFEYKFILKSFNKGQYEDVNGVRIDYIIASYTIDCKNNSYKIGIIDSYDRYGNFINGDYNRYADFQPIVEGTAINKISTKLCTLQD